MSRLGPGADPLLPSLPLFSAQTPGCWRLPPGPAPGCGMPGRRGTPGARGRARFPCSRSVPSGTQWLWLSSTCFAAVLSDAPGFITFQSRRLTAHTPMCSAATPVATGRSLFRAYRPIPLLAPVTTATLPCGCAPSIALFARPIASKPPRNVGQETLPSSCGQWSPKATSRHACASFCNSQDKLDQAEVDGLGRWHKHSIQRPDLIAAPLPPSGEAVARRL